MDAPLPFIDMQSAPDRRETFPQRAGMGSVRHTVESGKAESVHRHSAYAYLERIRSVPN